MIRTVEDPNILSNFFLPPPTKVITILDLANKFPIHGLLWRKCLCVPLNNMWHCFHVIQVLSCWIHTFVNWFFSYYYTNDNSCYFIWFYFIHLYYCIVFHNNNFINNLFRLEGNCFMSSIDERQVKVLVTQLCPTLCNPVGYSLPGSSVHGIL